MACKWKCSVLFVIFFACFLCCNSNLVPRVLRLFGQWLVARISAVKQWKPLRSLYRAANQKKIFFFEFSSLSWRPLADQKNLPEMSMAIQLSIELIDYIIKLAVYSSDLFMAKPHFLCVHCRFTTAPQVSTGTFSIKQCWLDHWLWMVYNFKCYLAEKDRSKVAQ